MFPDWSGSAGAHAVALVVADVVISSRGHRLRLAKATSAEPSGPTYRLVQTALTENPFSGQLFVFRGRRGDLVKLLWFDGDGRCLLATRLERGRFVWPQAVSGTASLSAAQLSMLLEGIRRGGCSVPKAGARCVHERRIQKQSRLPPKPAHATAAHHSVQLLEKARADTDAVLKELGSQLSG